MGCIVGAFRCQYLYVILFALAISPWGPGCSSAGKGVSVGAVTLSTTVTLPASSSGTTSLTSLTIKGQTATEETPRAGLICAFVNGDTDETLGHCITDQDGACSIEVDLPAGDHNLFIRVMENDETEVAGSLTTATVSDEASTVTTEVNSSMDLAYRAWQAACSKSLGTDCVPGENASDGVLEVVPECIRDAFVKMGESEDSDDDTAGEHVRALLEAHKTNLAQAAGSGGPPPIDMACVLKGDSLCQAELSRSISPSISVLKADGKAIETSDAATTASSVLDKVVEYLCGDSESYAAIREDPKYQEDPSVAFNPIAVLKQTEVSTTDAKALRLVMTQAHEVGEGLAFFKDQLSTRSMMETILSGGMKSDLTSEDRAKRFALILGAGKPPSFEEARKYALAATNMFGAPTWSKAGTDDCFEKFGPLLANEKQRGNLLTAGKDGFEQLIQKQGGLEGFRTAFNGFGSGTEAAGKFFNAYEQKGVGEGCTVNSDCLPPGVCTGGKCGIGSSTTAFSGGHGAACTADSQCATDKGFACSAVNLCVYRAGQQATNFVHEGGTATTPTAGTAGAGCSTDTDCTAGRVCLFGGCYERPTSITGGSAAGIKCTAHYECSSGNCSSGSCVAPSSTTSGTTSTTSGTTSTTGGTTATTSGTTPTTTTTTTTAANGSSCTADSACQSGYCGGRTSSAASGTCSAAATGSSGQYCAQTSQCLSGFSCASGNCQAITNICGTWTRGASDTCSQSGSTVTITAPSGGVCGQSGNYTLTGTSSFGPPFTDTLVVSSTGTCSELRNSSDGSLFCNLPTCTGSAIKGTSCPGGANCTFDIIK